MICVTGKQFLVMTGGYKQTVISDGHTAKGRSNASEE